MVCTQRSWSIGELARAAGVTVRALRYYDSIGLVHPGSRTEAGHRRYSDEDVARLYRVLALRGLGFELDQIAGALDAAPAQLLAATRLRLAAVERQLITQSVLRDRLTAILQALERAETPTTDLLIDTMEAMSMTVNLTRIYTRGGDGGETHLGDMTRVPKTHPRIEAYGAIDELNALIGLALTADGIPELYRDWLQRMQNDLFDLGADLSVPEGGERERLRVIPEQVTWLEEACDEVNETLQPLRSFVLPGGSPAAAHLHVARTVCRRAERRTLAVKDANPEIVRYLNRLSDLLFILSRGANAGGEEPLWDPQRYRE